MLAKSDKEVAEIEVHPDGSWTPYVRDEDNRLQPAAQKQAPCVSATNIPSKDDRLDDSTDSGALYIKNNNKWAPAVGVRGGGIEKSVRKGAHDRSGTRSVTCILVALSYFEPSPIVYTIGWWV